MDKILAVENLQVHFMLNGTSVKAVDGVNLHVNKGETLALIGESGSGKSVLGMTVLRLLPKNVRVSSKILFNGSNLLELPEEELRKIRGKEIALIPQNPANSLNNFHPRCKHATDRCLMEPPLIELNGNAVRCWLYAR